MTGKAKALSPTDAARLWVHELDRRQCVGELLVRPARPLSVLNAPATSQAEADEIARVVLAWMKETAAAGGPQDMARLWDKWVPFTPTHRHALRGTFDQLVQECRVREIRARQIVAVADSIEGAKQSALQRAGAERKAIAEARAALDKREAAIAQLEASA
jgi:hypothetical protein